MNHYEQVMEHVRTGDHVFYQGRMNNPSHTGQGMVIGQYDTIHGQGFIVEPTTEEKPDLWACVAPVCITARTRDGETMHFD